MPSLANLMPATSCSMAALNRCALAVAPKAPMLAWSRSFWSEEDREGAIAEQSLYLIPTYDDATSAMALLSKLYEPIFNAELDLWCVDRGQWPEPRSFDLFLQWFTLQLFPLVDDLGEEPLMSYTLGEPFRAAIKDALS